MKRTISTGAANFDVTIRHQPAGSTMKIDGDDWREVSLRHIDQDRFQVSVADATQDIRMKIKGDDVYVLAFGRTFSLRVLDPIDKALAAAGTEDLKAKAPMPGIVVNVAVKEGDAVIADQPLMTIESMKLLTVISAQGSGVIEKVHFANGEAFNKGVTLISITASEDEENA